MGNFSYTPGTEIYSSVWQVRSVSYTPRAGMCLIIRRLGSLSYTPRTTICLIIRRFASLSYTPRPGICLVVRWVMSHYYMPMLGSVSSICDWGVSLTRPVLQSVSSCACGEFLLHTPDEICLVVRQVGSFSYTPLFWHLSRRSSGGEFLLHATCCSLSGR